MLIVSNKFESLNRIIEGKITCEADNSWGEIFESVICEAYNNKGKVPKDSRYADIVASKTSKDPAVVYKNIFNSLKKYKMPNLEKLGNIKGSVTEEWRKLGLYKESGATPNNTPKTDIIGGRFHISIKEESGARLMSGAVNESIATIRAAIESVDDAELKKKADALFSKLTSTGTRARISADATVGDIKKKFKMHGYDPATASDDERKVHDIEELKSEFNDFVAEINTNSEIKKAIIYEALTGAVKFGENSESCANYILTWDDDGKCNLYTIEEFFNKFGSHYKVKAAFKSSSVSDTSGNKLGRDIWMVLSIT